MAVTTFFIEKKNHIMLRSFKSLACCSGRMNSSRWMIGPSMFQIPFVCTIIWCKEEVYEEGLEIKKKEVYEFAFLEGLQKLAMTNPECKWY